ncbi:MAG: serine endopeptidase, partial [Pseudobdellovibrio sp.]
MALGSARLTEKWINRGLWLIAFIFGGFLIGLGSLIVADLPHVQKQPLLEDFVDRKPYNELKAVIAKKEAAIEAVRKVQDKEEAKLYTLQDNYNKSKESFDNWVATRGATEDKNQNPEVIKRTKSLEDELNAMKAQEEVTQKKRDEVDRLTEELEPTRKQLEDIEHTGNEKMDQVVHHNQIQVFLYRLLLTLPLLLIAVWLFAKKRKTKHWPFIWGFIFFALFTFFVELVPYLPSYGGY